MPAQELPLGHAFVWTYAGQITSRCGHKDIAPGVLDAQPCNREARDHYSRVVNFHCAWCSTTAGMNVRCSCDIACASVQCPADADNFDHTTIPVPVFRKEAA